MSFSTTGTPSPPALSKYNRLMKLGEGTYGKVYLAENTETGERVALKKMQFDADDEGIPSTALREVALLKELTGHPNVVALLEVIYMRKTIYLVFPFVDNDLKRHMETHGVSVLEAKQFLWQLLSGVFHCHKRRILHRDLKPQNILVSRDGVVQLADFGLGRAFSVPLRQYTSEVVTLWYRAPEILLGAQHYSCPIDVWALGCIFLEMLTGKPLFPGDSEIDQLYRIFRTLGTPNDGVWTGVSQLPNFQPIFPQYDIVPVRSHFKILAEKEPLALDLIEDMLKYNPEQRISIKAAMNHPVFQNI